MSSSMLPPGLRSPSEVLKYYDNIYFDLINSGKAHPFIYPWASLGAFVVIAYLLIDHRSSRFLSGSRWLVFAILCTYQAWCLLTNKARNPAASFGVGLVSSYGTLCVATHMVVNDCQRDYKRIERPGPEGISKQNGSVSSTNKQDDGGLLYWQSYPKNFISRLDWVVDMFFSFRGIGWNWETGSVPDPPRWAQDQLQSKHSPEKLEAMRISRTGLRRFMDRGQLLRDVIPSAIFGYIALDALKTAAMNDPYFWGYTDAIAPMHYPDIIQRSHVLTKTTRLAITLTSVYTALWTIFKLGPIFFAGILGPKRIGLRGEAWLNPADQFGNFSNVLDKGLSGWWGAWWHQTFRYAFEAPATKTLHILGIDKRSKAGKMLSLFIAFFLSGCLHAAGSYTQLGETRPLRGPMSFFLLQGVGIVIETLASDAAKAADVKLPSLLQRTVNLIFVLFWLYHTAPLLADDFSQGGVWLFEPVPFSIFRGLSLGPADADWFPWRDGVAWWRSGNSWFDTGIAL